MEHPEADVADGVADAEPTEDGIATLLEHHERDEPRQRTLWQVLVLVLGWVVVLAIACVAVVIAAPVIETVVVAIVRAFASAGHS